MFRTFALYIKAHEHSTLDCLVIQTLQSEAKSYDITNNYAAINSRPKNNNPWAHAVLLLNLGLIIVRYRRKTRVKLALFKTVHVNYNDKDKVIVLSGEASGHASHAQHD